MGFRAELGARIKGRRVALRVSQRKLGGQVGVSATQICRIEAGDPTTTDTLERIADALQVTVGDLTAGLGPVPPPAVPSELESIVRELEVKRPDRVERAKGILQALLLLSTFTVIAGGAVIGEGQDGNEARSSHNAYRPNLRRRKGQTSSMSSKAA